MASPRHTRRPRHRTLSPGRWLLAPLRIVLALAIALAVMPFVTGAAVAADPPSSIVADGDQDGTTNDWEGLRLAGFDPIHDPVGNADTSTYKSSESEYPNWQVGSAGTPSGKSDIGNVYVYDYRAADDDVIAALAWDRAGDTGTGRYYVELNQKADQGLVPDRTVGDRRITIGINGSDDLECKFIERWTAGGWAGSTDCSAIPVFVNPDPIDDYFDSPNDEPTGTLVGNTFVELSVNLTDFGATACPVTGFQSLSIRSQEGGENGDTSSLKDRATGGIDIPSDCGSLVISKTVAGQGGPAGQGATFQVSPNPATGTGSTVVTTGANGTVTLGDVPPREYTVKELAPPGGALLPAGASATKQVTVGKGEAGAVTFDDDYGTGAWTKSYEGTDPTGTGATFTLTRTQRWSYDVTPDNGLDAPSLQNLAGGRTFDVTDNGDGGVDTASAIGQIAVAGLEGGRWCITEKSAPTGWAPAAGQGQVCFTVGPTSSSSDAHPSLDPSASPATFDNLLRRVTLRVDKTESSPGVPGSGTTLDGVTFRLYADANGAPGSLLDSQVTGPQGHASFSGLDWQKSYWLEEVALDGYRIGLSPNPKKISFTSSQAGTTVDVDVDNPRTEWSIRLNKVDGTTQAALTGGSFELWRESNGTAGLQRGGGTPDSHLPADQSLLNGSLVFDRSDHDIPWGYTYYVFEQDAPTGYGFMTPNPIVVDATAKPTGQDPTLVLNATDPQKKGALRVIKHDAETGAVVNGASFQLWKDTNGVEGLQQTAGGGHDADSLTTSCGPTAGGNPCSVDDLGFGTYFWYESQAPAGYGYPADRTQGPIVITAANVEDQRDVTVFDDPQIPAHIRVLKKDADTGAPLDGAKFAVYADTNENGSYDVGVDELVAGPSGTTGGEITFPDDLVWGTYFVEETAKPEGYELDANPVKKVEITRADAGTTIDVTFNDPQTRRTVTVDKKWLINGTPYQGGSPKDGFSATLGLTGGSATAVDWGKAHGGYLTGQTTTITESTVLPDNCSVVAKVTEKNGDPIAVTLTGQGYVAALPRLVNHYEITNTVSCTTDLTLVKKVDTGSADPDSWSLSATGPGPDLRTVTGTSGASGTVPSAASYALAEAAGTPKPVGTDLSVYQQKGDWSCVDDATQTAVPVTAGTVALPLDTADVTCTVTNTTARLTLVKHVDNAHGGDLAASAWDLTATPDGSLAAKTVDGSESGVTVEVRPGTAYALTESSNPGYHQESVLCVGSQAFQGGEVTVAAGQTAVCTFTNVDEQPAWTVSKASTTDPARLVPGGTITYTVVVKHTSGDIVPKNVVVQDDLSDVLLDAELVSVDAPAGTTYSPDPFTGSSLTWTIPVLDATKTLTYKVRVEDGAWDKTLVNGVTPKSPGGSCDQTIGCSTTNATPRLPRLTLVKDVVDGLGGDADPAWWTLTGERNEGPVPATATTLEGDGTVTSLVAAGHYTLDEDLAGGAPAAATDYTAAAAWSCRTTETGAPVTVTSGDVVDLDYGDDVTCVIVNTQNAHWRIEKKADRVDGATYKPGETIHYTLSATHTSGVTPTGVVVHDDLTELLKYATAPASFPAGVTRVGDVLTWDVGDLPTTKSVSFDLVVKQTAVGVTITNLATSPGSDNCPEASAVLALFATVAAATDPDCGTVHHTPAWTLTKSSVPTDGEVLPGSAITYTLTVSNTSLAEVKDMTVQDDISGLLGKVDPAFLTTLPAGVTYDGDHTLSWAVPTIASGGAPVHVDYTVHVKPTAWDVVLKNHATPKDVTGTCVGDNDCTTTHTTPEQPTLTLDKVVVNGINSNVADTAWRLSATPSEGAAVSGNGGFGPTGVDPGTYSLSETVVDQGVDPSDWTASAWSCVDAEGEPVGLSTGATLALEPDDDITCTITNTRNGEWAVEKSSSTSPDPLLPGGTITYTLKATHTVGVAPTMVELSDDLTDVMADANTFVLGSPTTGTVTRTPDVGEPGSLTWTIPSLPTTATLTFTVKVDDDAWDKELVNAVTSPGSTNCPSLAEIADECGTEDETPAKPRLTLVKNVTDPQDTGDDAQPADWDLSATDVQNPQNAASGNGDPSDVDGEDHGVNDVELLPGTFQLAEAGGPSGYAFKGWTCVANGVEVDDAEPAAHAVAFDAETNRVALAPDDDVTCTVTNEAIPGTFEVEKSSDPVDGATVAPGQTVTYTLTATHLAGVSPRDVVIEDDLSGVLDDATDFTVVSTTPAGTTVVNPSAVNGQKLSWTIPKLDTTATIVYSVKVAPDAFGVSLRNVVTAPRSTNCPTAQSQDADCSTTHPTAKWTLEKTSAPVSGTEVEPLDKVTYTLKTVNISDAAVTGMTVTDDLRDVLDDATLDAVPAGATLAGTDLVWNVPTLAVRGDSATLVYTVTVKAGASATTLHNVAVPDQPSGSCVAVDACETTHPVPEILGEEAEVPKPRPAPALGGVEDTLPATGGPDQVWILAGVALLLAGSGLVLGSRRRARTAASKRRAGGDTA